MEKKINKLVYHFSFMLAPHVWTPHVYTLLSVTLRHKLFSFFLSPLIIETRNLYSSSLHPHTHRCTIAFTGYAEKTSQVVLLCTSGLCRTLGKISGTWLTVVASCSPPFVLFIFATTVRAERYKIGTWILDMICPIRAWYEPVIPHCSCYVFSSLCSENARLY